MGVRDKGDRFIFACTPRPSAKQRL